MGEKNKQQTANGQHANSMQAPDTLLL